MLLVVWGHLVQYSRSADFDYFNDPLFKIIYSFHMPLFALISGFLFYLSASRRDLKDLIASRLTSLLYPIIMWCLIRSGISFLMGNTITLRGFISSIGSQYWFLYSILVVSLSVALAIKIFPKHFQIIAIFVFFIVCFFLPFHDNNLFLYPFFVVGYYLKKHEVQWKPNWKVFFLVSFIAFVIMLFFFEEKHYIYTTGIAFDGERDISDQLAIDFFRYAIGFAGSFSAIGFICLLKDHIAKSRVVLESISSWGKRSLQIYIIQLFALLLWSKILELVNWPFSNISIAIYYLLTLILSLIAIAILVLLLQILEIKVPIVEKILFGR